MVETFERKLVKMKRFKYGIVVKGVLYVLIVLMVVFIISTVLWILITPFKMRDFNYVLSQVLKNAGSYSTLLVGIVVTTFYQVYAKEKEIEQEDMIKISELGYYTLAFKRNEDDYEEGYNGDKIVVEICSENDYNFSPTIENDRYYHFLTKFLTSKKDSTNLKNIMAFGEKYFEENMKDIIRNYYQYCEKVTYASPLYCSTKSTGELENNNGIDRNRYYWLVLNCAQTEEKTIKKFWISAVTEEGIVMFVKVKAQIMKEGEKRKILLLQQTTYYKSQGKLEVLYR